MRSGIITDVITRQGPRVRERKGRTECYCRCRYHPQVDGLLTDELDFERGSPNWKEEAAAAAQVAVVVADQVESVGYRDRARALLLLLLFNSIRKDGQTLNIFPHSSSLFFLLLLLIIIYILDLHHHTRSWKAFICFGSRAVRARAPAGHARAALHPLPGLVWSTSTSFSHTCSYPILFNYISRSVAVTGWPAADGRGRSGLRVNYRFASWATATEPHPGCFSTAPALALAPVKQKQNKTLSRYQEVLGSLSGERIPRFSSQQKMRRSGQLWIHFK